MRYESEILHDLIERDGLLNPSQNKLPYESELKEKYIRDVEGAYPKLMDYTPEWLNYNLYHYIPSSFPIESITDVTDTTIYNVVPYAYKSAILSGNTLVNHYAEENEYKSQNANMTRTGNEYKIYKHPTYIGYPSNRIKLNNIEHGKTYTLIFDYKATMEITGYVGFSVDEGSDSWNVRTHTLNMTTSYQKAKLLVQASTSEHNWLSFTNGLNAWTTDYDNLEVYLKNIIVVEGDHTQEDIPYFEDMKSVKMPVLTTTGKNLLKPNRNSITSIHLKKGTTLILSTKNSIPSLGGNAKFYDIDGNPIWMGIDAGSSSKKFTLPCDIYRIENTLVEGDGLEYQLEVGTVATPYEPYKSNILTVNEDVELRGIDDVRDELNCLTGELTQRVGEVVLDGSIKSELWTVSSSEHLRLYVPYNGVKRGNCYSDKFINYQAQTGADSNFESVATTDGGFAFVIAKNKLTTQNTNGFDLWLSQNPTTIQYQLQTESIKTVDLNAINQDGELLNKIKPIEGTMHMQTSSETIPPMLSCEVPVEAITQNLNSFIGE